MPYRVLRVVLLLFVFLLPINALAGVADLHLKLPFPDGETWHTSCAYNGTTENGCATHGSWTNDRYALDFNHYNQNGTPDDLGKPIVAAAGGYVEIHHGTTGYGNYVFLDHGEGYVSRYAHLQTISVKNGQWVSRGMQIGTCGKSGTISAHLHFALYKNGVATKPEPMDGNNDLSGMNKSYTSSNKDPGYRIISDSNYSNSVSIAWYPSDVPCNKASVWAYNQTCSAEYSHPSTCQTAYDELKDIDYWKYNGNDWQTVFFGSIEDFQDLCYPNN